MYKNQQVLFLLMLVSTYGYSLGEHKLVDNTHCVIVILEAKKGKELELKEELLKVMEQSRREKIL
jgi:hypothetical protein